jgi:hypothetical protein
MKPTRFSSFFTVLALLAPGGLQAQAIRTWDGTVAGDLTLTFNAALGGAKNP